MMRYYITCDINRDCFLTIHVSGSGMKFVALRGSEDVVSDFAGAGG